jgi:hypothetical protein
MPVRTKKNVSHQNGGIRMWIGSHIFTAHTFHEPVQSRIFVIALLGKKCLDNGTQPRHFVR